MIITIFTLIGNIFLPGFRIFLFVFAGSFTFFSHYKDLYKFIGKIQALKKGVNDKYIVFNDKSRFLLINTEFFPVFFIIK